VLAPSSRACCCCFWVFSFFELRITNTKRQQKDSDQDPDKDPDQNPEKEKDPDEDPEKDPDQDPEAGQHRKRQSPERLRGATGRSFSRNPWGAAPLKRVPRHAEWRRGKKAKKKKRNNKH